MFKKLTSLNFVLVLLPLLGIGQNSPDYCLWSDFAIEKKLSKKFSLELEEELRFNQNISRLNYIHSSIGAGYRLNKSIRFALSYRFTAKYLLEDEFSFRHRLALDGSYRYSFSNFSIGYRSRIQSELKNYNSSKKGKNPAWEWRNKLTVKYTFNRIEPFINTEIFFQIKDERNPKLDKTLYKFRLSAGLDYKVNKRNDVGLFFLIQRGANDDDPNELNVLGLSYKFEIPRSKK